MKKALLASLFLLTRCAFADDAPPVSQPEAAANTFKAIMSAVTDRVDIGGTESIKLGRSLSHTASLSLFGKIGAVTAGDWEFYFGLAYSYAVGWDEHLVGAGATQTLFDTPTGILDAKNAIPVVGSVAPRMTKIRLFEALQVSTDHLTPCLTVGVCVPF